MELMLQNIIIASGPIVKVFSTNMGVPLRSIMVNKPISELNVICPILNTKSRISKYIIYITVRRTKIVLALFPDTIMKGEKKR